MKIPRKFIALHLGLALAWFLSIVISVSFNSVTVALIGIPLITLSLIIAFVYCRCPYCGSPATIRFLTLNKGKKVYCPRCGNKIESE
jgi:DNA-directed RNA polymerase subunit RPC12/RpoP